MSGEFDSRKGSYSTKLEQRPQMFIKLRFRELCGFPVNIPKVLGTAFFYRTSPMAAFELSFSIKK